MPDFEWDDKKNKSNKRKHRVDFNKAKEVFDDEHAIEFPGKTRTEVRFLRVGKTVGKVILAVVYTLRTTIIRIISARQANRKEVNTYINHKFTKNQDNEGER